jgi:hypothetical protein
MQFAYEVVKQVGRASEMVDEPDWYDVLAEVLMGLDTHTIPRQLVQTWFYLRYAALLGHELSLIHDTAGQLLQSELRYVYDESEMGLRASPQGNITADHIKLLRLINAKSLKVLAQVGGVESTLPDCWSVARQHAAI